MSNETLDAEIYRQSLVFVYMTARALSVHDLPAMIRAAELAQTTAPIFDPTLWIKKNEAMGEDLETLRAALPLWRIGQKMKEIQEQTQAKYRLDVP